jgi:hypothetical protein
MTSASTTLPAILSLRLLLIVWAFVTLRSRPSPRRTWLALAAIAALTMLPVYHRAQDTKLLLLTVPACAMLWAEGGRIGRLALLVTSAGFVLTGDLPWVVILSLIEQTSPAGNQTFRVDRDGRAGLSSAADLAGRRRFLSMGLCAELLRSSSIHSRCGAMPVKTPIQ